MARRKSTVPLINNDSDEPKKIYPELKCLIRPRTEEQRLLMKTIDENVITIVDGPAGSGKSLLSVLLVYKCYSKKRSQTSYLRDPRLRRRLSGWGGFQENSLQSSLFICFRCSTLCHK